MASSESPGREGGESGLSLWNELMAQIIRSKVTTPRVNWMGRPAETRAEAAAWRPTVYGIGSLLSTEVLTLQGILNVVQLGCLLEVHIIYLASCCLTESGEFMRETRFFPAPKGDSG